MSGKKKLTFNKKMLIPILIALAISVVIIAIIANGNNVFNLYGKENTSQNAGVIIGDKAYISEAKIMQIITGTGPWDANDNAGNDSSADNNIVRSFDQVTWNVDITMALKSGVSVGGLNGGTIDFEVSLPDSLANIVKWDLNSMTWVENAQLSSDGTKLTGSYSMDSSKQSVPGKQTLIFILKVGGATNGTEIAPKFNFKLAGNNDSEKASAQSSTVIVSSIPKYDISIDDLDMTYDVDINGNYQKLYKYGLSFKLLGDNTSKGVKGIEIPKNNLSFDIKYNMKRKPISGSDYTDITKNLGLYNYKYNAYDNKGLGNPENSIADIPDSFLVSGGAYPYSTIVGDETSAVYKNGNLTMVDDNNGTIHVTINDFGIGESFPSKLDWGIPITIEKGYISVGLFYMAVDMNEETMAENTQSYMEYDATNFQVTTIGDSICNSEVKTDNNKITTNFVAFGEGIFSKETLYTQDAQQLATPYGNGNAKNYLGTEGLEITNRVTNAMSNPKAYWIYDADILTKLDDKSIEPTTKYGQECIATGTYGKTDIKFNLLYAGKKDKTGWTSDQEMLDAKMEDLVYFDTLDELKSAGYTCVATLAESQSGVVKSGIELDLRIPVKIKENAVIGSVAQALTDVRIYTEDNQVDRSTQTHLKTTYIDDYPTPTWKAENVPYVKTKYDDNGQMISGTHAGSYPAGNSLLILGAKQVISIKSLDENNNEKTNFDIGKNENVVKYEVTPQITNPSGKVGSSNVTIKVEVTLPKGLEYMIGSSEYEEPEIVNNSNGTTLLTWYKYDCQINKDIEAIKFKASIDNESENGQSYEISAVMSEVVGEDGLSKVGNSELKNRTAQNYISIINLASHRAYKEVDEPIIEKNGDVKYKVVYENKTDERIEKFQLLDILPYTNDGRGSNFSGTYTVGSINVKQTINGVEQNNGNLKLYITNSDSVKDMDAKNTGIGIDSIWSEKTIGQTLNESAKGIALKGALVGKTKVELEITLKTNGNNANDIYANNAMVQVYTDSAQVETGKVDVKVVNRSISGKVWVDSNKNGIIDNNETGLEGVTLRLINTSSNNEEANTTTNTNGEYKFDGLPKGNYKVRIEHSDKYYLTEKNVGDNQEVNSKFNVSTKETDEITKLNNTVIINATVDNVNAGLIGTTYNITTEVKGEGGNISGENDEIYETVDKGGTNKKDIIISPNVGYRVSKITVNGEEIEFTPAEDGTVKLSKFTNMSEDKHIVVEFERIPAKVIVRYYIEGTTDRVPLQDGGIAQDVTQNGLLGDNYSTTALQNVSNKYELVETPANASGTMNSETTVVIYYYRLKATSVLVHHYIDGTETKVPAKNGGEVADETITGKVDDKYSTNASSNIANNYELVTSKLPTNASGTMTEEQIVVTYYYQLKDPTLTSNISKTSTLNKITSKDQEMPYTITYTANVDTYKGDAEVTIVDTLPYTIDESKSDLAGGTYNAEAKTITWKENITGIDSFASIKNQINITKEIKVVYKDLDVTQANVTNKVTGTINLKTPEKTDTTEVTKDIPTEYLKDVKVTKIWNDNNNSASKRPANVTVVLTGDGKTYKQQLSVQNVVSGNNNNWEYTFTNLPKYNAQGVEIDYVLSEEVSSESNNKFYSANIDQGNKTITNTFTVPDEKVTVTAKKVWNDNNNTAQKRPNSVTLTVTGTGAGVNVSKEQEITSANAVAGDSNAWEYTFTDLPKYDENGDEVKYTINEKDLNNEFYIKSNVDQATRTVTNTFQVPGENIEIPVTKIWDDNNNEAGKRPVNVTLQVKNGNEVVAEEEVTEADGWKHTFSVPKYNADGNEINYTIDEKDLGNKFYTKENAVIEQDARTITNKFEVPDEKVSIKVTKVWDDNNNSAGKRPGKVTMVLTGASQAHKQDLTVENADPSNNNNWIYTFNDLPKYDSKGNEINYILSEELDSIYYTSANSKIDQNTKTITNTFKVPTDKISIPVVKVWNDNNNTANKRPDNVVLVLTGNDGSEAHKVTLSGHNADANDGNRWLYTFTDLPKYNATNGDEIVYTLSEEKLNSKFYSTSIDQESKTVTNTFSVPDEKTSVTVRKVWNDNNNTAQKRPESVTLILSASGSEVARQTLTSSNAIESATNTWEYTFNNLKKYDANGNEIEYTLSEENLNNKFYTSDVNQENKTVTNTFSVPGETVSVTVTKTWNDNNNEAGKRPTSITLKVSGNGKNYTQEVTEANADSSNSNNWVYTFNDLPKYDGNGDEIAYTVDELDLNNEFYIKSSVNQETRTIVNTFQVPGENVTIPVTKIWDDNNDIAKKRPGSITIQVKNGEEVVAESPVTADTEWKHEFTLPKFDNYGNEIKYTIDEADLNNKYYEKGNVDQTAKTITNVSKYGKVIVHYYIEGTQTRVPDINGGEIADVLIEGKQGESYNTNAAENVKQNYELVATPSNATGTISAEDTEVIYYYRLKTPNITNQVINKTGTDRITVANQEVNYTVTYTAEITEYIGDAEVTIVDTLPYAIDEGKSDLAGGTYDSTGKTITWTENISDINSFTGNGTVNVTKNFKVVYVGLDMNQEKITNNVKGHIKLLTPEKTSEEVTGSQESTIYKAIISSEKLADKTEAIEGEKVKYTIRITNDGNLAKTVTVRDTLPAGITFDKDTLIKIGNIDTVYTEQNLKNGIPVEVPAYGSIDVVFAGKVDKLASNEYSKTLTNQATVDNEPTNEVTTNVTKANITAHKEAEPSSGSKVREGDEITYRIKVRNDGTRAGDVIVKDTIPTGTTFVEGSIKIDNIADSSKTDTDLANGIRITVDISKEVVVEFKVRVNKLIDGTKIKNTAYINQNGEDKKVPEEPEHTYVEPKEEQNISKTGTTTIESLEQEITYNINYTAKITDYSGRAIVKLVDKLPYAIDEASSDLAGGTYDAQAQTITWEEPVENIQITEEKEITVNKTIKVVYKDVSPDVVSIKNVVTGHIEYETPVMTSDEVTANATTTTGFTVNIPVSKVWEDDSNKLGQRPTSIVFKLTGSDGSEYTLELAKPGTQRSTTTQDPSNPNKWNDIFENLPKYDSNNQEIVYTLTEEEKTEGDLKYYDSVVTDKTVTNTNKYGKVIVHHYIMNTDGSTTTTRVPDVNGTEIPDVVIEGKEGDEYTTEKAKNINEKYELVAEKLPANATGKIEKYNEEKLQEVIYYYRLKPAKVLINYLEKDEDTDDSNNLVLTAQEQIDGHVDDSYNTDTDHRKETIEKDGKTYTLVSDSGNKTGNMTLQDITVTYYYLQNTKATVRYVERNPETGEIVKDLEEPTVKEGLVGDEFVTNSKDFIGYKLVESPEKTTINLTKEEQTLIYYYEPVYTGLIENHIDDKTGKILETETHEIQVGEDYNIPSKEFEGYDLVESKLPENAEGTMGEELVTVNYYYIKKAVLEVNYIDKLTGEPLADQVVDETKHEGDNYSTEEKVFENYDMIKVDGNKEGTLAVETDEQGNITNNRTIVTYYYAKKSAGVEEHHIDILTGEDIEEPTLHEGHVGDEYDIKAKEFLSYKLVEADEEGNSMLPTNAIGTMTEEKIVVNYYYNQPTKVIVHYVEKATGKEIEETNPETGELQNSQVLIEGQKDDDYTATAKEFEYYTLIEKPQEEQGKMKVEIVKDEEGNDVVNNTIELYYYYEAKPFNIGVDKEITGIIVNGERREPTNGKLEKVEIYRKSTESTSVQVEYKIKVSNTGEVSGNATIEENIPEGMSLANNDGTWEEQEGKLIKVIPELGAGETKEYTVLLNWEQSGNNMGEKANEVKLVETGNVPGFVDNNDKDNTSNANVIISVETGAPLPIGLIIVLVAMVGLETATLRYAVVLTKRQKKK